jgi:hypothetical protein
LFDFGAIGRESFEKGCRITQKELQKKRKKKEVALEGGTHKVD